ncbi:MAG: hypothetical protein FWG74_08960, partial [Planctomycetes bacterium]|nr:hypothetical protein [Planctomycetota bacterium]
LKLPESRREDAEMEYALGALEALRKNDKLGDIRAFQRQCGQNAMLKFLRREIRHERLSPRSCSRGAERISLDVLVPDADGEPISLAETIPDPSTETFTSELEYAENDAAMKASVRQALARLDPALADVAVKVLIKGMTQVAAAEAMGITRDVLRTRLDEARRRLQESLSGYRDDFNGIRFVKK